MADLDPGLASILSQIMGAGGGTVGSANSAEGAQAGLTLSQLQQLMMGTARQSITTKPFHGVVPSWVPPEVKTYVRAGVVDPYLGTGQSEGEYRVYMGGHKKITTHKAVGGGYASYGNDLAKPTIKTTTRKEDKTLTVAQAVNQPYLWDESEVASAIKKFQAAGITSVTDFDSLTKAWGSLVQRAGAMYSMSAGQRKVTPWDVLGLYKNEMTKAGTLPPDPNRTTTQVSRSVQDISEGDAWSTLQQTLSNMLGRDPSDQELRDFTYRMNSLAAHNPSITKTITKYQNGEVASQQSHTTEGFSAGDMAQAAYNRAQDDPLYAETQAGTTYFNAAISALGAIGG